MVSIQIDLSDDMRSLAEEQAKQRGISLEEFVRSCVSDQLAAAPECDADHVEHMRQGLAEARAAIERGDVAPWDKDAFLADRHREHDGS